MVKVLLPPKPEFPEAEPGMRFSVMPSPHFIWLEDYEYYDQLGRDPLQQHKIWSVSDSTERVEKLKKVLEEYPKQKHRRMILNKAARRGDEAIVRFFVETGLKLHPDIEKVRAEEEEAKKKKEEKGEDEEEEEETPESIPDKDDPSVTPINTAAYKGNLGCVRILIEEGKLDVETCDEFGRTPLIAAANGGETETIKYLLGQGANPTARMDKDTEIVENYFGEYAGSDALEQVAARRSVENVKLLLEHPFYGTTRKRKNREDEGPGVYVTPLAIIGAAREGSFETLKLLLERGAYPMEDKDGKTKRELLSDEERKTIVDATAPAAENGDIESLKLLLSYQYPLDKDGNLLPFTLPESLHKSFIYGAYHAMKIDSPEKYAFMSSFGVKEHDSMSLDPLPEGQLLNIQQLLDRAAQNCSLACAKLMINEHGASPHKPRIPAGVLPLYQAVLYNRAAMVRYLLDEHNADTHIGSGRFITGPTPLWAGITLKSLECIAILLQHGGPIDHVDSEIANLSKPMTAMLSARFPSKTPSRRPMVRFETEANAKDLVDSCAQDYQHLNPAYVKVELDPEEDAEWVKALQPRRGDEKLRASEGAAGRELDLNEAAEMEELGEEDPRRVMVDIPTARERQDALLEDDDLAPMWKPLWVAA